MSSEKLEQRQTRLVVMPGARMIPKGMEPEAGKMKFPLVVKFDEVTAKQREVKGQLPVEVSGGWGRMRAIEVLYRDYIEHYDPRQQFIVLVSGGVEPFGLSRAQEASKLLKNKYHLPNESVATIGQESRTLGNVEDTLKYIQKNKATLGEITEVDLVTQDYHMLRAWLMFVSGLFTHYTNQDFVGQISPQPKEKIEYLLNKSLKEADFQISHNQVIKIIEPYVDFLPFRFIPKTVENILKESNLKGAKRYVQAIEVNNWVKETRKLEIKGTIAFLKGEYK